MMTRAKIFYSFEGRAGVNVVGGWISVENEDKLRKLTRVGQSLFPWKPSRRSQTWEPLYVKYVLYHFP